MGRDWQKDFPTYEFDDKDIVVAEYENVAQIVQSEEKVFATATNITLAVSAGFGSIAIGSTAEVLTTAVAEPGEGEVLIVVTVLVAVYSLLTLSYFADRQRSITYAKRKMVVLRRMLGLSYGSHQLALPNERREGADLPLKIRLFPGWFSYVTYPFWIVVAFSAAVFWFTTGSIDVPYWILRALPSRLATYEAAISTWVIGSAALFRYLLYDTHENFLLSSAQVLAGTLNLGLIGNVENTIYQAKRSVLEHRRQGIDLEQFYEVLTFIEDRTFESHPGISLKALARAAAGYLGLKRASGGSTITQQLARTLLVTEFEKTIRRKLVEIPLALWIEWTFNKKEILDLHLCSVRFERKVYGVADAQKHFFGNFAGEISKAEVFFLVERISNIQSRVLSSKIDDMLSQAVDSEVLNRKQAEKVVDLYYRSVNEGKLEVEDQSSFDRLREKWS